MNNTNTREAENNRNVQHAIGSKCVLPTKPRTPRLIRLTRREKDSIMADLGLVKVRGAVSGRVYYE